MAQIRKRGRGFTISVYLGEGPDGKKRFYHETFYGTKAQARVRAAELEAELKKDRLFGPKPKGRVWGNTWTAGWKGLKARSPRGPGRPMSGTSGG